MGKATLIGLVMALLLVAAVGCTSGAQYIYIEPEVTISHLAKLYEPFTVTGKATALRQDLADAELWLNVTGAVYLEGEDRWHGPLKKGEEKAISAIFAFVTEGNQNVAASAVPDPVLNLPQPGLRSGTIRLHVSTTNASRGLKLGPRGTASTWMPGDPHTVPGGHLILADSTLLLNRDPSPRIEIIDSPADLSRLQSEGLIPQELRYDWLFLNPDRVVDFSKQFFIAFYDAPRPVPGPLTLMVYERAGNFVWDAGTLKGALKTHAIPMEESQAERLVSSVSVYGFGRVDTPGGLPHILAFQGNRTFEFTIDNGAPVRLTKDLQRTASGNAP